MEVNYTYRMLITKVVDGDSIFADADLGFKSSMHGLSLRINQVDTPECRRSMKNGIGNTHVKAGKLVKDWLSEKILDKWVIVKTYKDNTEKFGRWLCDIWLGDEYINQTLIDKGFAKLYNGGTKSKWTESELKKIIEKLDK